MDVNVLTVSSVPLMISLISQVIHYILESTMSKSRFQCVGSIHDVISHGATQGWKLFVRFWAKSLFSAFRNNKRT